MEFFHCFEKNGHDALIISVRKLKGIKLIFIELKIQKNQR